MSEFANGLTPAQAERLALLAEECGEVVQAVAKILRHGYESFSPFDPEQLTNREHLETEIGNVLAAADLLTANGDASVSAIFLSRRAKGLSVRQWLHHANAAPTEEKGK